MVMDDMQVVVEKQQRQRPAILDNRGAGAGLVMGAMFQKRADLQHTIGEISRKQIGLDRDLPDNEQPDQHQREARAMPAPHVAHGPVPRRQSSRRKNTVPITGPRIIRPSSALFSRKSQCISRGIRAQTSGSW